MKRILFLLLMTFAQVSLLHGVTYREYLSAWVGSWKGISTIYNEREAPLQLVEVEQNFWWDGDVLRGMTQFWSDDGGTQSQTLLIRYQDGDLTNEVVFSSGNKRIYRGKVENGALVWEWEQDGARFRIASKVVGTGGNREMQEECHQLVYTETKSQLRHIVTTLNLHKPNGVPLPRKIPDITELKPKE